MSGDTPAFPVTGYHSPENGTATPGDHIACGYGGMTLRDWFAGQALAASGDQRLYNKDCDAMHNWCDMVAMNAYAMADAMLRAREANDE